MLSKSNKITKTPYSPALMGYCASETWLNLIGRPRTDPHSLFSPPDWSVSPALVRRHIYYCLLFVGKFIFIKIKIKIKVKSKYDRVAVMLSHASVDVHHQHKTF
jgi:hypothetical protein